MFLLFLGPTAAEDKAFSDAQRAEVEQIIREYLLANPELLVEITEELERRRKALADVEGLKRLAENKAEIFQSKYDHVENPDGRIPLVEFFDYQCGYCKRIYPDLMQVRRQDRDVRMIFKEFPILGPASTFAARAAIAARRQDKYIELHDALMQHRGQLNEQVVLTIAEGVGLDLDRLKADMADPAVQEAIDANLELAARMNIRGTPTMFIGERLVPGAIAYRQMVPLLEEMRQNCAVC